MNNDELNARLDGIEAKLREAVDYDQRLLAIAEASQVTPETALQGFLSHRWKRRHGDIYHAPFEQELKALKERVAALEQSP